jgi:paraquat-inducible protein B
MSKQANFYLIGIFVIAAFILGVGTFIFFGATQFHKDTAIIVSTFRGSTNGLREGAKVKAYGVEVGQVRKIMLHRMEETDEVVIPVLMEIDLSHVGNLLGYNSLNEFSESECLAALERDAHATLQLDSFVTGLLYVEIIFGQPGEGFILNSERFAEYRAMPTLPTDMEVFFKSLQNIASNLGETDFVGLVDETRSAVTDIRGQLAAMDLPSLRKKIDLLLEETQTIVTSPEIKTMLADLSEVLATFNRISSSIAGNTDGTITQLNRTLGELEAVTLQAQAWMDPSNALYNEAIEAMQQITDAARSMRILAEYLERNPNALITGKPTESANP